MVRHPILLCSLLAALLIDGSAIGDLSLPPSAYNTKVGNFSIGWYLTPNKTIVFGINQTGYGYYAISYLPSMSNVLVPLTSVRHDRHRNSR